MTKEKECVANQPCKGHRGMTKKVIRSCRSKQKLKRDFGQSSLNPRPILDLCYVNLRVFVKRLLVFFFNELAETLYSVFLY